MLTSLELIIWIFGFDLYQNDLTFVQASGHHLWYQAMAGEVPILTADIQSNADDSVNVWDADQPAEAKKGLLN